MYGYMYLYLNLAAPFVSCTLLSLKEQALLMAWDAISLFLHDSRDLILYKARYRFHVRPGASLALDWNDIIDDDAGAFLAKFLRRQS